MLFLQYIFAIYYIMFLRYIFYTMKCHILHSVIIGIGGIYCVGVIPLPF